MDHRFQNLDRNTPLLLPPELRDWVAQDDLFHFIIQAVDRPPLPTFAVNHKGCGDEQYPAHLMLVLLIYCYATATPTASSAPAASSAPPLLTWPCATLPPTRIPFTTPFAPSAGTTPPP